MDRPFPKIYGEGIQKQRGLVAANSNSRDHGSRRFLFPTGPFGNR
jgi:hypothetical protein